MEDNVGTIVIATKVDTKGLKKGLNEINKKTKEDVKIDFSEGKVAKKGYYAGEGEMKWYETELVSLSEINRKENELTEQRAKQIGNTQQITQELEKQEAISRNSVEDLKGKIDFLSQQKDLSSFQTEQLKKYKAELEEIQNIQSKSGVEFDFSDIKDYTAQITLLENKLNDLQATYNILANETGFKENSQDALELKAEIEKVNQQLDKMVEKQNKLGNEGVAKLSKGFSKLVAKAGKLALALVGVRTIINLITRSFNTLTEYNEELGTKVEQMRLVLAVALEPIINWIINALQVVLSLFDKIYNALFGISLYGRANELWSKKMAKNMASGAGSAKEMRKQLAGFDEMNVLNDNVAGSGGGGFDNFEAFDLPDVPIPTGLQWIIDNAEPLGASFGGLAGGALLFADGLYGLNKALEVYDQDHTLENFGEVVHRIGESWTGLGMLTIDPVTTIAGSITAISGILTNHKEEVDKWVDDTVSNIDGKATWLDTNVSNTIGHMFNGLGEDIDYARDDFWNLMTEAQNNFDSLGRTIQKFKEGDIKGAWNEITTWISNKWNMEIARFTRMIEGIKIKFNLFVEGIKKDFDAAIKWVKDNVINPFVKTWNDSFEKQKNIVTKAINFVIGEFNKITNTVYTMGIAIGDFIGGAIKGAVNGALNFVEKKINEFISMINGVIGLINKIPGVNLGRISYISLPRMAAGGIINQPGRGVPVGGAIAGESGREGILPLTDKQAMAELGREIGKWISIQATVPINIGNRQVARVIQELNNDREFATNS